MPNLVLITTPTDPADASFRTFGSRERTFNAQYSQYLDPAVSLEDRLKAAFRELKIPASEEEAIRSMLAPLKVKHLPTYEHCIRVGLIARQIAEFQKLDVRALFYMGVMHDCGKAACSFELLDVVDKWTPEHHREMQRHVEDGFRLLRGVFDYTAEGILWHHRFQENGYPEVLPEPLHEYSLGTKVNNAYLGRLLALSDVYDSLHRINSKHGALSGEEIKAKMLQYNPDQRLLIEKLYEAGIFSTNIG